MIPWDRLIEAPTPPNITDWSDIVQLCTVMYSLLSIQLLCVILLIQQLIEHLTNTQHKHYIAVQNIIIILCNIPETPVTPERCDDMNGNITDNIEKEDLRCLQICESVLKG